MRSASQEQPRREINLKALGFINGMKLDPALRAEMLRKRRNNESLLLKQTAAVSLDKAPKTISGMGPLVNNESCREQPHTDLRRAPAAVQTSKYEESMKGKSLVEKLKLKLMEKSTRGVTNFALANTSSLFPSKKPSTPGVKIVHAAQAAETLGNLKDISSQVSLDPAKGFENKRKAITHSVDLSSLNHPVLAATAGQAAPLNRKVALDIPLMLRHTLKPGAANKESPVNPRSTAARPQALETGSRHRPSQSSVPQTSSTNSSTPKDSPEPIPGGYFSRLFRKLSSDYKREPSLEASNVSSNAPKAQDSFSKPEFRRTRSRDVFEVKTQNYYMVPLEYAYKRKTNSTFKEHFLQSVLMCKYLKQNEINPLQYDDVLEVVRKPPLMSIKFKPSKPLISAESALSKSPPRLLVIFDLDETLVAVHQIKEGSAPHKEDESKAFDMKFSVKTKKGEQFRFGVHFRPYLLEVLEELNKSCELAVFTAADKEYADVILKHIDKNNSYFKRRWYKNDCIKLANNQNIKDLRSIEGLNMSRSVLVDNSSICFGYQMLNGVPITNFYGNANDTELMSLKDYILHLSKCEDVRKPILDYFKWPLYMDAVSSNDELLAKLFAK